LGIKTSSTSTHTNAFVLDTVTGRVGEEDMKNFHGAKLNEEQGRK
jgi:hypothetical protein